MTDLADDEPVRCATEGCRIVLRPNPDGTNFERCVGHRPYDRKPATLTATIASWNDLTRMTQRIQTRIAEQGFPRSGSWDDNYSAKPGPEPKKYSNPAKAFDIPHRIL